MTQKDLYNGYIALSYYGPDCVTKEFEFNPIPPKAEQAEQAGAPKGANEGLPEVERSKGAGTPPEGNKFVPIRPRRHIR